MADQYIDLPLTVSSPVNGNATAANQATEIAVLQNIQTNTASIDTKTPTLGRTYTGVINNPGDIICQVDTLGAPTVTVLTQGNWGGLIEIQVSVDGIFFELNPLFEYSARTGQLFIGGNGNVIASVGGFKAVRLYALSFSGQANLTMHLNNGGGPEFVVNPDPAAFYATANIRDGNNSAFIKGQKPGADSLPVVIASDQSALPVYIVSSDKATETITTSFNEVTSVAAGTETSVIVYSVPGTKTGRLQQVTFSGDNKAVYSLYVNGVLQERVRTYYTNYAGSMDFRGVALDGPVYAAATTIELKVIHNSSSLGDFNGRIQIAEIG